MEMTDRELLELAAKAAEMPRPFDDNSVWSAWVGSPENGHWWEPLEDDGDALRLAVKLDIGVTSKKSHQYEKDTSVAVFNDGQSRITERHGVHSGSAEKATRYVIVRAAAEIGKAMQEQAQ